MLKGRDVCLEFEGAGKGEGMLKTVSVVSVGAEKLWMRLW